MNARAAIFATVSVVFLLIGNYYFFSSEQENSRERVIIARAIDGDTVLLEDNRTVRLVNINTPEKKERGYLEARQFLEQFEGETVLLDVQGTEKYGRLLGKIYFEEEYLNLELVKRGLAHSFLVNDDEVTLFFNAQQRAFTAEEGIWARSPLYGCIQIEIDKKGEYLRVESSCASTLKQWTFKDETTHSYTVTSPIAKEFVLWSSKGNDSETDRYWGRGSVWNDDRDSLFVRDENQLLVLYRSYGY